MPSDLQRISQGLVECLDQIPRLVAHLQRTSQRCRENAAFLAQLGAQQPALYLDAAATRCEEAAHIASQAAPKGRQWAERAVRSAGSGGGSQSSRPMSSRDAPAGKMSPEVRNGKEGAADGTGPISRDAARPGTGAGGSDVAIQAARDRILDARAVLARLPTRIVKRGHTSKTRGLWIDEDGVEHQLVSGRHEAEYHEALRRAEGLDLVRAPQILGTAADIELKFAMKMRREGIRKASIVINNVPCEGDRSCETLLPHFLPPGAELTIYGINDFVKKYRGESGQ